MSISNYDCTPFYYWYKTDNNWVTGNNVHFYNGQKYLAFADEPKRDVLDKYGLEFIGGGDINYIIK